MVKRDHPSGQAQGQVGRASPGEELGKCERTKLHRQIVNARLHQFLLRAQPVVQRTSGITSAAQIELVRAQRDQRFNLRRTSSRIRALFARRSKAGRGLAGIRSEFVRQVAAPFSSPSSSCADGSSPSHFWPRPPIFEPPRDLRLVRIDQPVHITRLPAKL